MTPEDIARKFQSASATCRGDRCPFSSECKGTRETCKIKEVALLIRAMILEMEELRASHDAISEGAKALAKYTIELEKINAKYYRTIRLFQDGYRPVKQIKKGVPYIGSGRKRKTLAEMDGDERYAMPEEPKEKAPPEVII